MYRRFSRRARPISGSCPACLGDMTVGTWPGGWALVCRACGFIAGGDLPERAVLRSPVYRPSPLSGSASSM